MNEDVLTSLAIATQFVHHATYAGTPRQAIADGYSGIDAAFSALMQSVSRAPSKNHKAKLDQIKLAFPNAFDAFVETLESGGRRVGGVALDEIETYYLEWLQARYQTFDVTPSIARFRVAQANRAVEAAMRQIAKSSGMSIDELTQEVNRRAHGFEESELYQALSAAHDHLFDEAERIGERVGKKFGVKFAAATNFCMLDLVASDDVTRHIIKRDEEIARECSRLHVQLCYMIEKLRDRRAALFSAEGMDHKTCVDESTNFMLALRFKYHGEKLTETSANLSLAFGGLFSNADEKE